MRPQHGQPQPQHLPRLYATLSSGPWAPFPSQPVQHGLEVSIRAVCCDGCCTKAWPQGPPPVALTHISSWTPRLELSFLHPSLAKSKHGCMASALQQLPSHSPHHPSLRRGSAPQQSCSCPPCHTAEEKIVTYLLEELLLPVLLLSSACGAKHIKKGCLGQERQGCLPTLWVPSAPKPP